MGRFAGWVWLAHAALGACAASPQLKPKAPPLAAPISEDPQPHMEQERQDAKHHAGRSAEAAPMERVALEEDAAAYAQHFAKPTACEKAARTLLQRSADDAWAVLRACADKGNFTALRELVSDAWVEELRRRPDAPQLLLRVIAARGGHLGRDLEILHSRKIPIFSIVDAARQPSHYAGQLILMRAEVHASDLRTRKPAVRLVEMHMGSELVGVEVSEAEEKTIKATGRIGETPISGRAETRSVRTRNRGFNVELASGVEALAEMDKADPFLSLGSLVLVLARFERNDTFRRDAGPGHEQLPVVTVIDYIKPRALLSH